MFYSELFCNKNKVFLPWWMGNDLNPEKAYKSMENSMGKKKGKDGKVVWILFLLLATVWWALGMLSLN